MKYYNVGKIVNTHGIRGEVKIVAITDFPEERFQPKQQLYIGATQPIPVTITAVREQKGNYLLKFKEFDNINQVEPYKGMSLMVSEEDQHALAPGQYYYHEIIGLNVETLDGEVIGTIKEVLAPGANDVWVVKRPRQSDLLLPVIDDVVKRVDLVQKKVIVELMEGLD